MRGKNIRVLYICNEVNTGGAALSLIEMVEEVRKYLDPYIIIPGEGSVSERFRELEVPFEMVGFRNGIGRIGMFSSDDERKFIVDNYEAALKLVDIIENEKIDVVHTNSSVSNIGAFAALLAGRPHVWHIRELLEEDFSASFFDKNTKLQLFSSANRIISISSVVQKKYLSQYSINTSMLYNGLNILRYTADIPQKKEWNKECVKLLIVGRATEEKGHWDVLLALNELVNNHHINCMLTMVGGASEKIRWGMELFVKESHLDHNCIFLPFTRDLQQVRLNHDYYIMPSRMEALGRVTIEAMLSGCVVIGADTGETPILIGKNEERGYIFRQGSVNDLTNTIIRAIEDSSEKKLMMRKRAYEFATSTFDVRTYARQIQQIYMDVIKEYKPQERTKQIITARYEECRCVEMTPITYKADEDIELQKKVELFFEDRQYARNRIEEKLHEFGIKKLAIYGIGKNGRRLYDVIAQTNTSILYVIDKNPEGLDNVMEIVSPEQKWNGVDAVVVSILEDTTEINKLAKKNNVRMLLMSDLVE